MWTANRVQAAPVKVSREHLEVAQPQAVVANSGVANAATGRQGELDAKTTAAVAGRLLDLFVEEVLVLSTGVIGVPLPVDEVLRGLEQAAGELSSNGGEAAARAILTTDTRTKQSTVNGHGFTIGGMAKGSGMIHPNLATMLAVLTTDYPLHEGEAIDFLGPAVDVSFNAITVDGECSTNDAVCLLANGAADVSRTLDLDLAFAAALRHACSDLAQQIVADGEGATVLAEVTVTGAASQAEARALARRIATSSLVKTALFGRDANWGRVLAAAGSAPFNGGFAQLDPDRITLRFDGTTVMRNGIPQDIEPPAPRDVCSIELHLGLGDGSASYLTSDLSYDYVRINADYRT
jgi:glutamate N-acetyltransferase/amino-acid N-acetyltransferase